MKLLLMMLDKIMRVGDNLVLDNTGTDGVGAVASSSFNRWWWYCTRKWKFIWFIWNECN